MRRIRLSWSSGKDSAWALHVLRQQPEVEVAALVTTFNEAVDRVAMHAVRRELVEAQAEAAGLPLWPVMLPWPCSNEAYESRMREVLERGAREGVTHMAFGDLFLEEIRAYRINLLKGTGIEPLFPIWTSPDGTHALAREMVAAGLRAVITCVDSRQLDPRFAGSQFHELLEQLPDGVDPCGERGEFHTFCYAGPMFRSSIDVAAGEVVCHEQFHFADLTRTASTGASRRRA